MSSLITNYIIVTYNMNPRFFSLEACSYVSKRELQQQDKYIAINQSLLHI